jgi:hypothetical protein
MWACPRMACTSVSGEPPANSALASEWRSIWGETSRGSIPAFRAYFLSMYSTVSVSIPVPRVDRKKWSSSAGGRTARYSSRAVAVACGRGMTLERLPLPYRTRRLAFWRFSVQVRSDWHS